MLGAGDFFVDVINRGGIMEPRGSAKQPETIGILDKHTYSQGGDGELSVRLLTVDEPTNDTLEIAGKTWLGGKLTVSLVGPDPKIGTTFDIVISQDQILGQFDPSQTTLPILTDAKLVVSYLSVPGVGDVCRLTVVTP